jgi:large subunit ribosomal protein L18
MEKIARRNKRRLRIRSKVKGTAVRPRLSVFRSNKAIVAQLIDDEKGVTIVGLTTKHVKDTKTKSDTSFAVGELIAEKAKAKKISTAVFDRGGFQYHGRIKALADGARKGGLQF